MYVSVNVCMDEGKKERKNERKKRKNERKKKKK